MPRAKTSPKQTKRRDERATMQRQALELRKAGATYQAIADQLGLASVAVAYNAVQQAVKAGVRESTDELRAIGYERLNAMMLSIWGNAQRGDLGAVNTVIRLQDKIDSLFGTEAPQQIEQHITTDDAVLVIGGESKEEYLASLQNAIKKKKGY